MHFCNCQTCTNARVNAEFASGQASFRPQVSANCPVNHAPIIAQGVEGALDAAREAHRTMAKRVEALEGERAHLKQMLLTFAASEVSMSALQPLLDCAAEMKKEDA